MKVRSSTAWVTRMRVTRQEFDRGRHTSEKPLTTSNFTTTVTNIFNSKQRWHQALFSTLSLLSPAPIAGDHPSLKKPPSMASHMRLTRRATSLVAWPTGLTAKTVSEVEGSNMVGVTTGVLLSAHTYHHLAHSDFRRSASVRRKSIQQPLLHSGSRRRSDLFRRRQHPNVCSVSRLRRPRRYVCPWRTRSTWWGTGTAGWTRRIPTGRWW